jgi:arylsulfatase A-like enzyme
MLMSSRAPLILSVGLLAAVDLSLRRTSAGHWAIGDWATYAGSLAYAGLWANLFWRALERYAAESRPARVGLIALVSAASGLIYGGQYVYYEYFGVLPGVATYRYFFDEPEDVMASVTDATAPGALGMIALAMLLFVPLVLLARRGSARGVPWKPALAILVLTPMLYNNVAFSLGNAPPSVQALLSLGKAGEQALLSGNEYRKYLHAGTRIALPDVRGKPPVNVLIIINESLRAQTLSLYGFSEETTPALSAFRERHRERTFLFENFYTNSTTTRESFPSLLTGVHPVESFTKLHRMPLLYEYGRVYHDTATSLISSHAYSHNNFRLFVRSKNLDHLFSRENAPYPVVNNAGISDRHTVAEMLRFLDGVPPDRGFFGVAHLNGTHHPYNLGDELGEEVHRFLGNDHFSRYKNAVLWLDTNLGTLLDGLERRGLLDDTAIVFTSDHGEAFGEHGAWGHQRLFYEEVIRIPFWIYLPKPLAAQYGAILGENARRVHSNVDIAPTLIALLGLERELREIQHDLIGRNLLAANPPGPPLTVVQNGYTAASLAGGFAALDDTLRLLVEPLDERRGGNRLELYDLAHDPLERNNLWDQTSPEERERWIRNLAPYPSLQTELGAATGVRLAQPERARWPRDEARHPGGA